MARSTRQLTLDMRPADWLAPAKRTKDIRRWVGKLEVVLDSLMNWRKPLKHGKKHSKRKLKNQSTLSLSYRPGKDYVWDRWNEYFRGWLR